jgi:hypothetical protein
VHTEVAEGLRFVRSALEGKETPPALTLVVATESPCAPETCEAIITTRVPLGKEAREECGKWPADFACTQ